jgi:hypothetical protein
VYSLAARALTGTSAVWAAIVEEVAERIRGVKCPICWDRTKYLPAHIDYQHCGEW